MEFHASILFCPSDWKAELDVWAHANGTIDLGQRVKKAFDPSGTFARGRLAGDT
jgi:FAD/FMN-containing dehydrogenase